MWGILFLYSKHTHQPLPLDTESRLAAFTELVATAIANADSRAGLTRLANEQAALRRIATLVARGAPADELFSAVSEETGQLLHVGQATMIRYGSDGTSTIVTNWRRTGEAVPPVGARERLGGNNLTTIISQTRRPARMDSYADASGAPGVAARGAGFPKRSPTRPSTPTPPSSMSSSRRPAGHFASASMTTGPAGPIRSGAPA